MSSVPVSRIAVVDSNIILSAILGFRSRAALDMTARARLLRTTVETIHEVGRVLIRVSSDLKGDQATLDVIMSVVQSEAEDVYASFLLLAGRTLRNAVASRNGSDRDAHLLALAWTLDADIWSHDRDFAGAGWPSWSSANLAAALSPETLAA